jgi:serine phosphatase RsbU (regulator of sigma subunit)
MLSIAPDRLRGRLHLAGHPQPVLITASGVSELQAPISLPPGISHSTEWPSGQVELGDSWSVMIYTDGLIEGKIGSGRERLGSDGLVRLIEKQRQLEAGLPADRQATERLIDGVINQARELNGGDLDDDLAVLVVSCTASASP